MTAYRDNWATPAWLFRLLDAEYGPFDLDAAAESWSACCERFVALSPEQGPAAVAYDAMAIDDWPGRRIWLNPPYGKKVGPFLERAAREASKGKVVVALIPGRSDCAWWHDVVLRSASEIRFLRGRVAFVPPPRANLVHNRPLISSVVAVFGKTTAEQPRIGPSIDAGTNHKSRNLSVPQEREQPQPGL